MLKLKALLDALKFWKRGSFPDAILAIQFRDYTTLIPIPSRNLECKAALVELVRVLARHRKGQLVQLIDETASLVSPVCKAEPTSTAELLDKHEEWQKQRDQQQRSRMNKMRMDLHVLICSLESSDRDLLQQVLDDNDADSIMWLATALSDATYTSQPKTGPDKSPTKLSDWAENLPPDMKKQLANAIMGTPTDFLEFIQSLKGGPYEVPEGVPLQFVQTDNQDIDLIQGMGCKL